MRIDSPGFPNFSNLKEDEPDRGGMVRFVGSRLMTISLLSASLVGCSAAMPGMVSVLLNQPIPIERLRDRQTADTTVLVQGTVGDRVPLINGQVYQLQDETGLIWVQANDTRLRTGDRVTIRGILRFQSVAIEGQEQGELYVEQQEQIESP